MAAALASAVRAGTSTANRGAAAVDAAPCKLPSAARSWDEDSSAVPIQLVSVRRPDDSTLNTSAPDTSRATRLRNCAALWAAWAIRSRTACALPPTQANAFCPTVPTVCSAFCSVPPVRTARVSRLGSCPDTVGVGDPIALRLCGLLLAFQLGGQVGMALLQGLYSAVLGAVVCLNLAGFGILRVQLGGQLVAQRFIGGIGHTELRFSPRIQPGVYFVESGSRFGSFLAGGFQIVPQLIPFGRSRAEALFHRIDFSRGFFGPGLQLF